MQSTESPLVQFTTNSFVGNPTAVIFKAAAAGMGLMFLGISIGTPVYVSMALLFGGIGLVYGYLVGKVTYSLLPKGIEQKIRRFIPYYLSKDEEKRFIAWENIHSYKNDTDYSRQVKEYEYIKLYLNIPPKEIWITNQVDEVGFNRFKTAFLQKIEEFKPEAEKTVFSNKDSSNKIFIKKKKSFYQSLTAKILTLFFVVVAVGIAFAGFVLEMGFTNWIKFAIVLLPGTIYMFYRVFVQAKK